MDGLFNSKRVILPKNQQIRFINKLLTKISIKKAANLCDLSERTIRDWGRGKFSMDLKSIRKLSRITRVPLSQNIKLKDQYWYAKKGAPLGGKAVVKKYGSVGGDAKYRRKKWFEWWEKSGRFNKNHNLVTQPKPINRPIKSKDLAEFCGIMLGDGGMSEYQLTITLHHIDDKDYSKFVIKLIQKLFKLNPSIYHNIENSVNDIVVSRINLIKFLQSLGLVVGDKIKQQINIPKWIQQDKKFLIACIRGLFDTDGSVVNHRYNVNNKIYLYKKIDFTSRSFRLIKTVHNSLRQFGINNRIRKNNQSIKIENTIDVKKYFKLISSHNPKHLKKYAN
jgi:hypothetical protein